ncbi:MAG: pilus assembly protein [Hymenobacter sp.]|nr:MAG: pilus assembly protein [Hymenobacter sp.]
MLSYQYSLALASRFRCDTRAVSAIEFALILPIILAILVGSLEFSRALDNRRKVALLARTLADLTSQAATTSPVTAATMNDIIASSQLVLRPFASSSAKITVSALGLDLKSIGSNPRVCSSFASNNATVRNIGLAGDLSVPPGFRAVGMRYILAEVQMPYTPVFGSGIMNLLGGIDNKFTFKAAVAWPVRAGKAYKTNTYNEIILPNGSECPQ